MAEADTNTSKSMTQGELPAHIRRQIEASLAKSKGDFDKEPKVSVSIPKNLANRIGRTLPLGINGVRIVLPVDGTKHEVPKSFADLLQDYLANVRI